VNPTEALIATHQHKFRAERGTKLVYAAGRGIRVHTAGERTLILPNGRKVKVTTAADDVGTQVEEPDNLHAIIRPQPNRLTRAEAEALGRIIHNKEPK
jgi:hypothetical protein